MNIFFDTEFTGLHKDTTLISIGMIDEMGATFYAEFSDYDQYQVNDWIQENVIKHLKWSKEGPYENFKNMLDKGNMHKNVSVEVYGNRKYVIGELTKWLYWYRYDDIQLVSDCCHYDMVLFIDLFGTAFDLPENICPVCYDINQEIAFVFDISERKAFDLSREMIVTDEIGNILPEGDKHNSLYDAKIIRLIYTYLLYTRTYD